MSESEDITEMDVLEFKRCMLRGNQDEIEKLYRMYGPTNPIRNNHISSSQNLTCSSSPNGICHMMTCECHEKNWFTGFCLECNKKIQKKENAWRLGKYEGGFIGCYCSKVHSDIEFLEYESTIYYSIAKVMFAIREKFPIYGDVDCERINDEDDENLNEDEIKLLNDYGFM